jgi:hypothetical protein
MSGGNGQLLFPWKAYGSGDVSDGTQYTLYPETFTVADSSDNVFTLPQMPAGVYRVALNGIILPPGYWSDSGQQVTVTHDVRQYDEVFIEYYL